MESYQPSDPAPKPGSILARNCRHCCTMCGKQFSRSDSLKRHYHTHDVVHRHWTTRRRSCLACVRSKTRCSEDNPTCERCEIKGLPCTYATGKRRSGRQNDIAVTSGSSDRDRINIIIEAPRDAESIERTVPADWDDAALLRPSGFTGEGAIRGNSQALDGQAREADLVPEFLVASPPPQQPSWPAAAVSEFIGVGDFYPTLLSPSTLDWCSVNGFSNIFAAYPRRPSPSLASIPVSRGQLETVESQGWPEDIDHGTGAIQGHEVPVPPLHYPPEFLGQYQQSYERQQPPGCSVHGSNPATNVIREDATTTAQARGSRAEYPNSLPELVTRPGQDQARGVDPFPIRFSLPSVDSAIHDSLRNYLQLPLLQSPWQPMSLTSFPSGKQLDYFIDLYFSNFDMLLPMIHRPTFDPSTHPVLTLSMCLIGVFYSDFENASAFGKSLGELLRRLFLFMSEQNVAVSRNYDYLAAQTLQSVLGNSSGGKQLFEFGDNNRGLIVANARAVGLFMHHEQPWDIEGSSLQKRWEYWIRAERSRRLAWCIYIFDATATYYRNCRPHLSLAEIKVDLPCWTCHWEADSPQAWAMLHPWSAGTPPPNASFAETLGHLFQDSNKPAMAKVTDEFQRIIMSTTLLRMVWDHRESMRGPGVPAALAGLLSHSVFPEKINTVLSVLGDLTTSALRPAAQRAHAVDSHRLSDGVCLGLPGSHEEHEFYGLVHRARISLVAQIIAADQISDHLDAEWHRRGTGGEHNAHEVTERRLRAWADANPIQPRRMAIVGAQLLAIARLYPYHMPREPYDAFRAGLLLWTMVPLVRAAAASEEAEPPNNNTEERRRRVCQLDWLGDEGMPEAQAVHEWVEHGGDGFVLRIHGVADICTVQGSRQVLQATSDVLKRLHVWGASKTYRDIVLRALREGTEAETRTGYRGCVVNP